MILAPDSYRILEPELDWPFFDPAFRVDVDARGSVRPLGELASSNLWQSYVSDKPSERHPMLLPSEHWLRFAKSGPDWVVEFNNDFESLPPVQGRVSAFLQQCFEINENETVFFVAMRERSYAMPMVLFLRHWPCFLAMDDEGSFLFHPTSGGFAQFGPNGSLVFGHRKGQNAV